jgi:hypothetical protein
VSNVELRTYVPENRVLKSICGRKREEEMGEDG